MKFVALVSGGKDSLYSIVKAIEYGHDLVCVANLAPLDETIVELNSFMYQSACHNLVPLISKCLCKPLYRHSITGIAIDQSLSYPNVMVGDEVEDLYNLLCLVLLKHPDIEAVSTGAIASTYQRHRVEDICCRLRLQSLCYLWQRDRSHLLHEIVENGLNAVLVKVAGAGLIPHKHLGKCLGELSQELRRLNVKYGLDLCGEGGEYETFVLDMPMFKYSISIQKSEILVDEEDDSVGNLKVVEFELISKPETSLPIENTKTQSVGERTFFQDLATALEDIKEDCLELDADSANSKMLISVLDPKISDIFDSNFGTISIDGCSTIISTLECSNLDANESTSQAASRQINSILTYVTQQLVTQKLGLDNIYYVHLFLSDMSLFQAVNEEYCNFFGKNPPSRTCISLPFSSEKVSIQAHFSIRPTYIARKVLHVMSISEWAPSCIGPYSQANVIGDSLIFLAGQIPLVPGTMKVQECNSTETEKLYNMHLFVLTWSRAPWWPLCCIQLTACIRHISKLLDSLDSSPNKLVSFTIFVNVGTGSPLHNTIDLRVFENIFKLARLLLIAKCRATNNCDDENEKSEDDQEEINVHLPAISVIGVQGLPRNSLIEVEAVALTNVVATGRIVCMRKGKHKIELVDVSKDINVTQTCRPVPIEASWPFWSTNISRAISFSEAAMFEPQKVLEGCTGIQLISSYFKFYPNVFSFGTFTLMFDIENGWNCVACVIASCLRDYLIESETDIESIKRILIVYSSDSDFTSLKSLLEYYFQILIGIKLCPIIFLPSLGMNVEEGTSNFRISILWEAFNLDKICTEKWLSKDS